MKNVTNQNWKVDTLTTKLPETVPAKIVSREISRSTTSVVVHSRSITSTRLEGAVKLRYSPRESISDDDSTESL